MRAPKWADIALWLLVPLLICLNQSCIKLLAKDMENIPFGGAWLMEAVFHPWFYGILLCEMTNFALWLHILSNTAISRATPITALAYILVLSTSWFVFLEPILPMQIFGSLLILAGVWMIGTAQTCNRD